MLGAHFNAVREFNAENEHRKIWPLHLLRHMRPQPAAWNDHMYVCHDFLHPRYVDNVTPAGDQHHQLPLG